MDAMGIAVIAAVAYSLLNFVKLVRNQDWNGAITMASVWVVVLIAIVVIGDTRWGDTIDLGGMHVSDLSFGEQLLVALVPASFGIVGFDVKKALDNTDSAKSPALVTSDKATDPA